MKFKNLKSVTVTEVEKQVDRKERTYLRKMARQHDSVLKGDIQVENDQGVNIMTLNLSVWEFDTQLYDGEILRIVEFPDEEEDKLVEILGKIATKAVTQ